MTNVVSMEEFGPVAVDVFNGRRVAKVTEGEAGTNDAVWSIYFEGEGVIHNYDPTLPAPRAITGAALTMTILGIHKSELDRTPLTELRFGLETVQLNPLQYAIYEPRITRGMLVFAQRSNANMPAAHPDERVAEGPSEPEPEGRQVFDSAMPEGDVGHLLTEEEKEANRQAAAEEEERLRASEREHFESTSEDVPEGADGS